MNRLVARSPIPDPWFTDRTGRTWRVDVDAETVEVVRGALGIDLAAAVRSVASLDALFTPPSAGLRLLLALVRRERWAAGVTPGEFRGLLSDPDAFRAAVRAAVAGVAFHFPASPVGAMLATLTPPGETGHADWRG
jgi:hypothetical protein